MKKKIVKNVTVSINNGVEKINIKGNTYTRGV